MRIGIFGGGALGRSQVDAANLRADGPATLVEGFVDAVRSAERDGFDTFWVPQGFGPDSLTLMTVAGREVDRIELATAVVPVPPRHPVILAAQALTTQACIGGRLTLGLGVSHRLVVEGMLGLAYDRPARDLREYLAVLMPLLHSRSVAFEGEVLAVTATLDIQDALDVPVLVAAMGPNMLGLAGTLADGTVTWLAGPATISSHVVPLLRAAAARAGRGHPRVAVSLPVCVTDDRSAARARALDDFARYDALPAYRAVLAREGVERAGDVAIIGDERSVASELDRLAECGATDLIADVFGTTDERSRTRALLAACTNR